MSDFFTSTLVPRPETSAQRYGHPHLYFALKHLPRGTGTKEGEHPKQDQYVAKSNTSTISVYNDPNLTLFGPQSRRFMTHVCVVHHHFGQSSLTWHVPTCAGAFSAVPACPPASTKHWMIRATPRLLCFVCMYVCPPIFGLFVSSPHIMRRIPAPSRGQEFACMSEQLFFRLAVSLAWCISTRCPLWGKSLGRCLPASSSTRLNSKLADLTYLLVQLAGLA